MEIEYRDLGEISIDEANDANVPVGVFIYKSEEGEHFTLRADNFMPRKNCAGEGMYEVQARSREDLVELVKKYIVPLYKAAVQSLEENGELYYFSVRR